MFARLLRLIANRRPCALARVEIATTAGPVTLQLELADKSWRRALGLMGKTQILDNDGMLFVYPRPRLVRLWMANTALTLDAIFVDGDGCILKIAHRLQPYSRRWVSSEKPAKWVLEIAGGQSMQLGIAAGDQVRVSA
jgi:uncharacterized membrane protein (UPF0127 family)